VKLSVQVCQKVFLGAHICDHGSGAEFKRFDLEPRVLLITGGRDKMAIEKVTAAEIKQYWQKCSKIADWT
jgi:hypothetical protein